MNIWVNTKCIWKGNLLVSVPIWQASTHKHVRMLTAENRWKRKTARTRLTENHALLYDSEYTLAMAANLPILLALHSETDYTHNTLPQGKLTLWFIIKYTLFKPYKILLTLLYPWEYLFLRKSVIFCFYCMFSHYREFLDVVRTVNFLSSHPHCVLIFNFFSVLNKLDCVSYLVLYYVSFCQ